MSLFLNIGEIRPRFHLFRNVLVPIAKLNKTDNGLASTNLQLRTKYEGTKSSPKVNLFGSLTIIFSKSFLQTTRKSKGAMLFKQYEDGVELDVENVKRNQQKRPLQNEGNQNNYCHDAVYQ